MYTLPDLSYDYDALGSYISKDIMYLHHDKHHRTYVDKLNDAIKDESSLRQLDISQLLTRLDELPDDIKQAVRNNGGGHFNHGMFWNWMTPHSNGQPSGELLDALVDKYGSFQEFVDVFTDKALGVFGSGWAWLQPDLDITTSPNQDNPIMDGKQAPILGLDVWEHAYYLDYKNSRPDYVKAWWNVVNWDYVEKLYMNR